MSGIAKQRVYVFHDETPYNGSLDKPLVGETYNSQSYDAAIVWLVPATGYNGKVTPELSPDGEITWLNTDFAFLNNANSRANELDFAVLGANPVAIVIVLPEAFQIRMRMSGGSAGKLTAKGRIVDGRY